MKEVRTEIEIQADAGRVWEILMDFPSYPEWNPFIRRIGGKAKAGECLEVHLTLDGKKVSVFYPIVTAAVPYERFSWLGRLGLRGLFDGEHIFSLQSIDEKNTMLTHRERFSGVLALLFGILLEKKVLSGFDAMNKALKERAEGRPIPGDSG